MKQDLDGPTMTDRPAAARRGLRALAAVGVVAVIAAGCGSAAAKTSTPVSAAPAAGAGPSSNAPASATISAKLTEFHIALSRDDLKAGTYTFAVTNAGHTVHSLEIDGPGVSDRALPKNLDPGQTGRLTVTLKAGKYDVFCPVGNHKMLGMNLELTVTA
jgi:uncharacterized cupredoxin-like copper-binding protein